MSLGDELRQLLSSDAIADDPETLAAHSGDKWFAAEAPEVVVFARSTSDISKLLKLASQKKIAVTARGAGFGLCSQARRLAGLECTRLLDDEPRAPEAITVAGVEDANLDLLRLCRKPVHQRCDRAIVSCLMISGQRPQRVGDSPWQHLQPRREIVPGPAGSLVLRQLDIGAGERCAAKRGNDRHFIGWIVDRC